MDERVEDEPFFFTKEYNEQLCTLGAKRKFRSKKMEFVGWGSKPLIEFLESIGKNITNQLTQHDLTAIVNDYVNKNNLLHPQKKKKILCDERLHSLFGRKSISRIKIHDMLEMHLAENQEESDDDFFYNSDEYNENVLAPRERLKVLNSDRKNHDKKKVTETPKSCFAAIVPDNIKLVYLKRSLVQDLIKDPETFEFKLVGSFVRIKSDPNDLLQKNSYLLLQVTGVKKALGIDNMGAEFLLQFSNLIKDIKICMLSDDNFSEEECEDLRQRMKDGLLKRLTVVELQEKVQILHEDITKHWLVRELALLQNLIDQANEKGWRKELFDYTKRRQQLQNPSDQSKLLVEIPKVVTEEMELEACMQDFPDSVEQSYDDSPRSNNINEGNDNSARWEEVEIPVCDIAADGTPATSIPVSFDSAETQASLLKSKQDITTENQHDVLVQEEQKQSAEIVTESNNEMQLLNVEKNKGPQEMVGKLVMTSQVIALSDDDQNDDPPRSGDGLVDDPLGSLIWHYLDPHGHIQGPFSMTQLKVWQDRRYFPPGFKVWKMGQNQEEAVLLSDSIHQMFLN